MVGMIVMIIIFGLGVAVGMYASSQIEGHINDNIKNNRS